MHLFSISLVFFNFFLFFFPFSHLFMPHFGTVSLALMGLQEKVTQYSHTVIANADVVLHDQFLEYVADSALHRELKRRQPTFTFLEIRAEAF